MAGNTPRGIRKRLNSAGAPRYQVRYLVRDPTAASGWVETSATFATLREAKAFKAERDNEAALGARRFDPRLGRIPLSRIWEQYSASKKPAVSAKTWSGYTQHWHLRIAPQFGHIPVDEISRASVQQFVDTLTVGPWAKVSTLRLLRSILDVAREDGRIHRKSGLWRLSGPHPRTRTSPLPHRTRSRRPGRRLQGPRRRHHHLGLHRPALVRTRGPARRRYRLDHPPPARAPSRPRSRRPHHHRPTQDSRRQTNCAPPPDRHRRTHPTYRRPSTRSAGHHVSQRRNAQIQQLAQTLPLVTSPAHDEARTSDDP